jgi:hypothetical protein
MNLYQLVLTNIKISPSRRWMVMLCALPVARLASGITIVTVTHTTQLVSYDTRAIRMRGGQTLDAQGQKVAPGQPGLPEEVPHPDI